MFNIMNAIISEKAMKHSSNIVFITYLIGLEVPELKEEYMRVIEQCYYNWLLKNNMSFSIEWRVKLFCF